MWLVAATLDSKSLGGQLAKTTQNQAIDSE